MSVIITSDARYGRYVRALTKYAALLGRTVTGNVEDAFSSMELKDFMFGYLQLEAPTSKTGKSILQTSKGNLNTDNPDAILLDKNDVFISTGYAFFIRRYDPATKVYSSSQLFTYPSKTFFDGAVANKTPEADALRSIFGGSYTIKVGTQNIVEERKLLPFLKVPNAPYTANDPQEFSLAAALEHFPKLDIFFGNQNYDVLINYGTSADWDLVDGSKTSAGADRSTRNQIVMLIEGYRAIGAASAKLQIDF
jgi:hypothetical protein